MRVYIHSSTFYDSEPVPFTEFERDWNAPFHRGERFISYKWHELGINLNNWGFGVVYRNNVYLKFNSETALAVHTLVNKQPIQEDSYTVDVSGTVFNATGFRVFHKLINKSHFSWQMGLTSLYGSKIIDGTLKGKLNKISESDYEYDNITLNYYYTKDELFDHQVGEPKGYGFALDTDIYWQPSSKLELWFTMRDILGRIYWQGTPITMAEVESDNKTYDDNYVKVDPLLRGNQSTKKFTQTLPLYLAFKSKMRLNNHTFLLAELEHLHIKTYARFGFGLNFPKNVQGEVIVDAANTAVGLRASHHIFNLTLMSDQINPQKAHFLAILFNLKYEF